MEAVWAEETSINDCKSNLKSGLYPGADDMGYGDLLRGRIS